MAEVTKALAKIGCTLVSLKVVLTKNMGARTNLYAMHFATADGSNPKSDLFYLLKPAAGFRTADGVSFHINLSRELLAKFNVCYGCHRFLERVPVECTCATRRTGPITGTRRQRDEAQASTLHRYMQMQRMA